MSVKNIKSGYFGVFIDFSGFTDTTKWTGLRSFLCNQKEPSEPAWERVSSVPVASAEVVGTGGGGSTRVMG